MINNEVRYMYLCMLKNNYSIIDIRNVNDMIIVCVTDALATSWDRKYVYLYPRK